MTVLSPEQHLVETMRQFPDTTKWVNTLRAERGKELPDWPKWCFVPLAVWSWVIRLTTRVESLPYGMLPELSRLGAIGTWRYSQGIYRFDKAMLNDLAQTSISGDLPSDVLYRLPEWCVYVETPGFTWLGNDLQGFWAHLEWDANTHRSELRFLLNQDDLLFPFIIHLGSWSIQEAVSRALLESESHASRLEVSVPSSRDKNSVNRLADGITPALSLLLYLCSQKPDINSSRTPGESPERPKAKRVKGRWKLFPAKKSRVWEVGKKYSEAVANSIPREGTSEHKDSARTVRPHVRKGHWHGFWKGPRDGERRFVYHWIPPIAVRSN